MADSDPDDLALLEGIVEDSPTGEDEEVELENALAPARTGWQRFKNPSNLGYPPTLPVEIALRHRKPYEICPDYGITADEWDLIRQDPIFIEDLRARVIELKKDGMSFRLKAKLMAEQLLDTSWQLIHQPKTPHAVKADLIKFTVRAAGLDGSKDQAGNQTQTTALQINLNLG